MFYILRGIGPFVETELKAFMETGYERYTISQASNILVKKQKYI